MSLHTSRVAIGSMADPDNSGYAFTRNSGLPYGTFDDGREWRLLGWAAVIVSAGGLILAIACGWGG